MQQEEGDIYHDQNGFIYAFKVYQNNDSKIKNNHGCGASRGIVDCLENFVHRITDSDIIHVEIIPVLGMEKHNDENNNVSLLISNNAYSAYVGLGFDEHESSFCTTDPTYKLVYIPMSYENMLLGMDFLQKQRGKKYNYFALPLTVLPSWCKKRKVELDHEHESAFSEHNKEILQTPDKVFCSQLGLTVCYLCQVFPASYDFSKAFSSSIKCEKHSTQNQFFIDPMCCTPAELYNLLMTPCDENNKIAVEWPQMSIKIMGTC